MNTIQQTTYQALCAFALLGLAGCSADSGTAAGDPQQTAGEPVRFTMAFGQTATRAASATTLDGVWPDSTVVTIALVENGSGQYDYQTGSNSSALESGASAALTPVNAKKLFIWTIDDPQWKFAAWYPAGNTATTTSEVASDQRDYDTNNSDVLSEKDYSDYDLLYCPPTLAVHTAWAGATLTFYHQLARIFVKVNSSLTDGEYVTNVAFGGKSDDTGQLGLKAHITKQPTTAGNGETTWAIDGGQTSRISHMRYRSEQSSPNDYYFVYECLLPPQSVTAANLITISTDGSSEGDGKKTYVYPSEDKLFQFKSGHQYTYELSVSQQGVISLTSLQVTDWQAGAPIGNTAVIQDNSY